jgi:GH24 family phage-related lysozyme (muramidase)
MVAIKLATELLIKPFEGYHKRLPDGGCKAYPDPGTGAEPWTIGWGSTGRGIYRDTVWTRQQAEQALEAHVKHFAFGVLGFSPGIINEPPRRFAALISFSYNCGLGNYKISTLRKRVNQGDWNSAYYEIQKWNKAAGRVLPGLVRRRLAEANLLG